MKKSAAAENHPQQGFAVCNIERTVPPAYNAQEDRHEEQYFHHQAVQVGRDVGIRRSSRGPRSRAVRCRCDSIIDVATGDIPNADPGFLAIFSASYFSDARSFWIGLKKMAVAMSTCRRRKEKDGSARRCSRISTRHRRSCTSRSNRLGMLRRRKGGSTYA